MCHGARCLWTGSGPGGSPRAVEAAGTDQGPWDKASKQRVEGRDVEQGDENGFPGRRCSQSVIG